MANEQSEKEINASAPADAVKPEAPKAAAGEAKAVKENVVIEKPTQCPVCKKGIKNKWYYRNGKYFCCKGCFQKDSKGEAGGEKTDAKPKA